MNTPSQLGGDIELEGADAGGWMPQQLGAQDAGNGQHGDSTLHYDLNAPQYPRDAGAGSEWDWDQPQ